VPSQRLISNLIRSGWFTKQRQLNLLRKAACKVVRFRAADKAGQPGDEGWLVGHTLDAILKPAAEVIGPWFL
jgi:hypothetical protein